MTNGMNTESLVQDLQLTDVEIRRRLRIIGFEPEDRDRVMALKDLIARNARTYTDLFFDYLASRDEVSSLMNRPETLETARRLKNEHLKAMVLGEYGPAYVEERIKLGLLYAGAGLAPAVFLGAYNHLLRNIGSGVMEQHGKNALEGFGNFMSLMKIAFFDVGLIVDVIVFERERTIRRQEEAIRELSTPAMPVRDGLLILPIIGAIDTQRARQLTEHLLDAIRAHRAKVVVVDITGVPYMDATVANQLAQTVVAARLTGARMIVSGLTARVSETLLTLGLDVSTLDTFGDLRGAIEEAERVLGYTIVKSAGRPTSHLRSPDPASH
jgi:rsbT co-antagonist protein RsbR